ncbi:TonB-dependent receptor [Haliea sp. E17]|uniref:TonB-dependent receptor n=1 Tax=Haliea sp. E17 TaxID=3401576 RepID=UPI003AAF056E
MSCSLLALGSLALPGVAIAQDSGAMDGGALEEVVVTARRRSEGLSRVPISVSAINSQQMLERNVFTDADLQSAVPGLTIRQTQGNNSLTYSIRGQSADTFSGSPSAVVAYFNEVPLTISGASTFYDLDSIQVLKGPQGTLFGRNTTGGAVLYTSAKPTDEFEGKVTVRVGNYDLREVEGMINIPITDSILLRGAFDTLDRDGYIDNILTGDQLGELERDSGRVSLTFSPGDKFDNTTVFAYSDVGGTNTGASYTYSVYECGQTNNGFALNCAAGSLYGPVMDQTFQFPGAWDIYLSAHPEAYAPGIVAYVEEQKRLGYYKTQHPWSADHDGKDWIVTNHTTYEISDNLQIKNIFGASNAKTDSTQPQLGAPFITILTANVVTGVSGNETEVDSISDEIQLNGNAFGDKLTYVAGLYYQNQETETLWPQTYFDLTPLAPPVTATNAFRITTETMAAYFQADYSLTDALSLTAGARYTSEDVEIEHLAGGDAFGYPKQDETFDEPSWELGLSYALTDDLFSYIKYRGSFRSGGFNGSAFPPMDGLATEGGNLFDVETVEDVEAGLKFRGTLGDMPATMNLAVYQMWVEDVQRIEFPDPDGPGGLASIAVTANVPEMEVKGVELDASIGATDWLELGVSGAYTDAEFTDGDVRLFGVDYSYSPVANTPEYAGTLWGRIDFTADGNAGDISLYAEIYAQDDMWFSNTGDSIGPDTEIDGYELVNARLEWKGIMGSGLGAALIGRNLTDEEHFVGGMPLGASLGHNATVVGAPRMYAMELSYQF